MDTTITAKLKLVTTPEQYCQLRLTQLAYRDAWNQASQHTFAELRSLLTYKAALTGSVCISVYADHTSQCLVTPADRTALSAGYALCVCTASSPSTVI